MKITKKRDTGGLWIYYDFKGKFIKGTVWWDGSGYLEGKEYFSESGKHEDRVREIEDRVREIENLVGFYNAALKELKQFDKKLKFSAAEKRGD